MVDVETALNRVLHRFGVQLKRERPRRDAAKLLLWKAEQLGVRTLIDVGANVGQFAMEARAKGWQHPIVSFEPLPDAHAELSRLAARDPTWIIAPPMAIGAEAGQATIHVAENVVSSSLLPMEARHLEVAPTSQYRGTLLVDVRTLDSVMDPTWEGPYALKVDTQGFELEVLKGALQTVRRSALVVLEMALTPMYKGGGSFGELCTFMEQANFRPIAFTEAFADTEKEEVLQMDGVFIANDLPTR